jgi:hypothetical protein
MAPNAPRPSAVPQATVQPTYKALGAQTTPGASLLPVFSQSQAIGPLANYINKDTPYWAINGTNGGAEFTSTFSTLYVSSLTANSLTANSITANNASISTIQNSSIVTTSINIDGQLLDADSDQLFLNGIPLATTANISSIEDWSFYDAVSTVRMNNNAITGISQLYAGALNATTVSSLLCDTSSLTFVSGSGDFLTASTVNTSQINTSSINTNEVRITSTLGGTGDGVLTVSGDGNTLFFNNAPVGTGGSIASNWSLFPSISTIRANNPIYNAIGRLQLSGQGIDIGALGTTPSGSTNTMVIQSGDINITSDGGGGFNCATGLNLAAGAGFALSGGAGGAITTGLVLLIQAGGALGLSAAGAVTMQAAGACSMAAAGPVNIGSQAYTSLETIRIDNSLITRDTSTSDRLRIRDVQELQGNNDGGGGTGRLDILGNGVTINISSSAGITMNSENTTGFGIPLVIKANGTTGSGIGTQFYSLEQQFNPSSQTLLYNSATTNLTGVFPPITVSRNCKNINALNGSTITRTMSETYDGQSTITYANSLGAVNITGITNLTAGTINTTTLGIQNLNASSIQVSSIVGNYAQFSTLQTVSQTASSIQVSSIVGNYGEFSTLRTSANNIGLGNSAGLISTGGNAIAIGTFAGYNTSGSNSIAIGNSAGYSFTGRDSVMIGTSAVTANNNTIVLNATGGLLDGATASSCYIAPVRQTTDTEGFATSMLRWNSLTKEVSYAPLVGSLQVVATSGTAINLLPTLYGKTYVLTGTTTQAFTTTSLTINDAGWFCIVHNGNATNGGDVNMTGMTGTTIIHEQKASSNGGNVYLYWNGTTLTGY